MLFLYLGIIVGLLFLLFWSCINCTVRQFRPEFSVGQPWWPKDGDEYVVNSPGEQVGQDAMGKPPYPFASPKKEKEKFLEKAGNLPRRVGVTIVRE